MIERNKGNRKSEIITEHLSAKQIKRTPLSLKYGIRDRGDHTTTQINTYFNLFLKTSGSSGIAPL